MYRLCLLILSIECLLAAPVYDANDRLNVSASCPDAACSLWQLQSDFQQPLRYSGNQVLQLQELLLGNCQMRQLPVELLRLTPNLRTLLVHNSSVYHVNKDDFKATPQLRQLQLQSNHISRLKEQQFVALPQLEVLQLGHNIIHFAHAQAFVGLSQLKILGLQGNGITQLMEGVLDPLTSLVHLDLSDNEIPEITTRTFANNTQLQTLLLNGNKFVQFDPNSLLGLSNLRLLELSSCQLEELRLPNLQKLIVDGSGVKSLIIEGGVISLKAGNNPLTKLQIADKSAVIELDLHGNLLNGSDASTLIHGMWNLQRLDLSKNNIDSLWSKDGNFSHLSLLLPSLTHLNLAHNQLISLPPESTLLPYRLTELDISHNHLVTVTVANFAALPNLQRLYMEGVRLTEFDYQLFHRQHPNLRELGICDDDYRIMHRISMYLTDRGVQLPLSCAHKPKTDRSSYMGQVEPQFEPQSPDLAGVDSIHPYLTKRDILALLTLLVVFIILLLQLYNILEEEGCVRRLRLWCRGRQSSITRGPRTRRLDEQDSERSSE